MTEALLGAFTRRVIQIQGDYGTGLFALTNTGEIWLYSWHLQEDSWAPSVQKWTRVEDPLSVGEGGIKVP